MSQRSHDLARPTDRQTNRPFVFYTPSFFASLSDANIVYLGTSQMSSRAKCPDRPELVTRAADTYVRLVLSKPNSSVAFPMIVCLRETTKLENVPHVSHLRWLGPTTNNRQLEQAGARPTISGRDLSPPLDLEKTYSGSCSARNRSLFSVKNNAFFTEIRDRRTAE